MPQVWNKEKRLSVHITPARRAEQFPTELTLKNGKLFCKFCEKPILTLRMDNLRLHLTSLLHRENKQKLGVPLNSDNVKQKYIPGVRRVTTTLSPIKTEKKSIKDDVYGYTSEDDDDSTDEDSSDDDDTEEEPDEELSQLFDESDTEGSGSFEGFDDDSLSTDDEQSFREQSAKVHDRSNNSIDFTKKHRKRKRSSIEDGSPIPFRSMPLKKQMSYTAKASHGPPRKRHKGKLKIKICRQPNNQSFQVESSDEDASDSKKVTSSRRSHDGLKMKFLLNKKNKANAKRSRKPSQTYSSDEILKHPHEQTNQVPPQDEEDIDVEYDQEPNMFEGVEELIDDGVVTDGVEVVEEEIVGIDDDEVVSWDAVVGEEVVEEEVVESSEVPVQPEPELTSEESLTQKANYAREMAKAVNSAQFKKKRLLAQKQAPKIEEKQKRKLSAYNLWSSRMRKQVADQYPGLQFGEVSKKLGNLWKKIPDKEKQMWKHRSNKMTNKMVEIESNTTKRNKGSKMIETGPKKKPVAPKSQPRPIPTTPFIPHKNPEQAMKRELQRLPNPSIDAMDAAAHFKLLGASLVNIAKQVKNSRSSPHKSVPLLLDGLLCSLAPLLSLTNKIPQLQDSVPDACLVSTYCNNAHIMPGF